MLWLSFSSTLVRAKYKSVLSLKTTYIRAVENPLNPLTVSTLAKDKKEVVSGYVTCFSMICGLCPSHLTSITTCGGVRSGKASKDAFLTPQKDARDKRAKSKKIKILFFSENSII